MENVIDLNEWVSIQFLSDGSHKITIKIDESYTRQFKNKFLNLKTIGEKLSFWQNTFKVDYCFWSFCNYDIVKWFRIATKDPKEIGFLNKRNLDAYVELITEATKNRFGKDASPILDLDKLKRSFKARSSNCIDFEDFILLEIKELNQDVKPKSDLKTKNYALRNRQPELVAQYLSFKSYIKNKELLLPDGGVWDIEYLGYFYNGMVYAQYLLYLEQLLDHERNINKRQKDTPIKVQLALLDFLGVLQPLLSNNSNVDSAQLLSILLNSSSNSIRSALSDDNSKDLIMSEQVDNMKYLDKILKTLEKLDDKSHIQRVRNEIDRIKTKKL
ncbi:MAG: hypothetical protein JXR19_01765 [Bacteroidia bacterium]